MWNIQEIELLVNKTTDLQKYTLFLTFDKQNFAVVIKDTASCGW